MKGAIFIIFFKSFAKIIEFYDRKNGLYVIIPGSITNCIIFVKYLKEIIASFIVSIILI